MRWLGHYPEQANNDVVKEKFFMQVDGSPRKRERLKLIWMEVIRIDPKKCIPYEDLARDRLECKTQFISQSQQVGTSLDVVNIFSFSRGKNTLVGKEIYS